MANNIDMLDAAGGTKTVATTDESGVHIPHNRRAPSATPTLSNVSGATSSTTLLASNASRRGGSIVNESSAILYIKLGSAASATSYSYALAAMTTVGAIFEIPEDYTGIITGIWASATGAARVTERTA